MVIDDLDGKIDHFVAGRGVEYAADGVELHRDLPALRFAVPLKSMCSRKWETPQGFPLRDGSHG